MIDAVIEKRQENAHKMLQVLEAWRTSGMSKTDCCKVHGVATARFYEWYKRYQKRQVQVPFTELQVETASAAAASIVTSSLPQAPASLISKEPVMELQLSAGRRIVFYEQVSADYLKSLLG